MTLISALEAFVSAAKKLPREDVYDVVEGYIKISVECAEIFQLLSGEKRPESEVCSFLPGLMGKSKSLCYCCVRASWWLSGKESPTKQETQVQSLGRKDPLEKETATHSSILAWKIPWTEEPGGLQSTGLQKSWTQLSD